jgi:glutathione peroxidase
MRLLSALAAVSVIAASAAFVAASAEEPAAKEKAANAYAFEFHAQATALYTADGRAWTGPKFEDGQTVRLANYTGHPILVVNTAAHCGFTPQFDSLQHVYSKYRDKGLVVIGVQENDFANQGGSEKELAEKCGVYSVDFPQMKQVATVGPDSDPFYKWVRTQVPVSDLRTQREGFYKVLAQKAPNMKAPELSDADFAATGFPSWNFNKVLIDQKGKIVGVFNSGTSTTEVQPELITAIEKTLASS